MAIALDDFQHGASDAQTATVSITVSTGNILVVLLTIGNQLGDPIADSVTFNGSESFTKVTGSYGDDGDSQGVEAWYLVNPTATTANVVVDYSGSGSPDAHTAVWSLSGVDTSSPIGAVDKLANFDSSDPIGNDITTTADGSWVLQTIGMGAGSVDTGRILADSGQTKRSGGPGGVGASDYDQGDFDLYVASAGVTAIDLVDDIADGDYSMQLAVEIKAAAAAGTALQDLIQPGIIPFPR